MSLPVFHIGNKTSFTIPEKYRSSFAPENYSLVDYHSYVSAKGYIDEPQHWYTGYIKIRSEISSYNASTGIGSINKKTSGWWAAWSNFNSTADYYLVPTNELIIV